MLFSIAHRLKQFVFGNFILFVIYAMPCVASPKYKLKHAITTFAGTASLYSLNHWFRQPCNNVPTSEQLNTYTLFPTDNSNYTMNLHTLITNLQNKNIPINEIIPVHEQIDGIHADHQSK